MNIGLQHEIPGARLMVEMMENSVELPCFRIEQRQARREKEGGKRKITDIALLKTIARYLVSVIGSILFKC